MNLKYSHGIITSGPLMCHIIDAYINIYKNSVCGTILCHDTFHLKKFDLFDVKLTDFESNLQLSNCIIEKIIPVYIRNNNIHRKVKEYRILFDTHTINYTKRKRWGE